MQKIIMRRAGLALYSASWVALGTLCLIAGDFLASYEPVPSSVSRLPWAFISAIVLIACGLGLMLHRTRKVAAVTLAADLILWIVVLQPVVISKAPTIVFTWLPLSELGALLSGAIVILSGTQLNLPSFLTNGRDVRTAQVLFGISCFGFAASHFVYGPSTAAFIPNWIPERLFLAYFTGAGHLCAGLAILSGVRAKLAARLEAAMMSSFVLLVHIPSLFLTELPFWAPDHKTVWMALFIAIALSGSAWLIASSVARRSDGADTRLPASAIA
jgi:uncharacterized membrane protein YphA (DoxX/SURF4 family)